MSLKTLFTITAVLTALLGLSWFLFPGLMLAQWNVAGNHAAEYMSRRYGVLFFGYSIVLWCTRTSPASPARSAIMAGTFVVCSLIAIVSLLGVLSGTIGPAAWAAVIVEVLLAAGFGYLLFSERGSA